MFPSGLVTETMYFKFFVFLHDALPFTSPTNEFFDQLLHQFHGFFLLTMRKLRPKTDYRGIEIRFAQTFAIFS